MDKIIFSGCSLTAGTGFDQDNSGMDCLSHPGLWVNLCHLHIPQFNKLLLINNATTGASNADIFTSALESLSVHNDIKFLICAWTSMPRYTFHTGFELYNTRDVAAKLRDPLLVKSHYLNNQI